MAKNLSSPFQNLSVYKCNVSTGADPGGGGTKAPQTAMFPIGSNGFKKLFTRKDQYGPQSPVLHYGPPKVKLWIHPRVIMNIKKRMLCFTTNRSRAFKHCFALTVTVRIYKVLWPKRLKIGMIKKQQCNRLKNEKNWMEKTFACREFSVLSRAKTFANLEFRFCLGRNFREKCKITRKSQKFLPAKVSAPKVHFVFKSIGTIMESHSKTFLRSSMQIYF